MCRTRPLPVGEKRERPCEALSRLSRPLSMLCPSLANNQQTLGVILSVGLLYQRAVVGSGSRWDVAVCACSTPPHPTPQQQRRTHQQSHPSGLKHGAERRAGVAAATATATVRGKVLEGTTAGNRRRVNPHGEVARAPSPDARSPRRSHNGFFHRHRGWAGGRERPHEAGRGGPSQPPKPPDKPPAAAAGGGDGAQTTTPEKWASGVVGDNERCAWKFERCG